MANDNESTDLAPTFRHYLNPKFNDGRGVGVRHSFETLWNSTGGNWDDDPFVWVVSFKKAEATVRAMQLPT